MTTEKLLTLLRSTQGQVRTDEAKTLFITDLMKLRATLNELVIKCESVYANDREEEKCENEKKLKTVNDY
ncbi:MAG: hypothetical protein ACJA0U_001081 [Salibacteraceae bacterium]